MICFMRHVLCLMFYEAFFINYIIKLIINLINFINYLSKKNLDDRKRVKLQQRKEKLNQNITEAFLLFPLTRALAGMTRLLNWTSSPSAEIMPSISCCGEKCRELMPSKHFLRWGCTRCGSFVSDRISSSSSLDKKKNLQEWRELCQWLLEPAWLEWFSVEAEIRICRTKRDIRRERNEIMGKYSWLLLLDTKWSLQEW